MPLTAVNFIPQGPIKSADLIEFFNLFTGAMTDQPVTFANTLTVGGSQGAGSVPLRVGGVVAQTASMVELRTLAADVQPVFSIDKAGSVSWGPGGGVGVDTSLARSGVGAGLFTGALTVSAGITTTGTPDLKLGTAASRIVPGVTSFSIRNNANNADNFIITNAGAATVAGGLMVTAGNVGIGAAPKATWGINVSEAMSSDNSNAFGIAVSGSTVLTATANNVSMYGLEMGPAFVINGKTGLTLGGINVEAITGGAGATSTYGINIGPVTGGGTNNYGVYINAPSGASSNNIGLFVAGGSSYGIQNNGGAILCGAGTSMGFFGVANAKQTVTGSKGANAALTSLMAALTAYGLVTDTTT